jgi:hypothetical protein
MAHPPPCGLLSECNWPGAPGDTVFPAFPALPFSIFPRARRAAKSPAYSLDGGTQGQGSSRALLMPPGSGSGLGERGPEIFQFLPPFLGLMFSLIQAVTQRDCAIRDGW